MNSPFPGMDPYLEAHWDDIHPRLIVYLSDQLQPQLPKDLRAKVEQGLKIVPPIGEGTPRTDVHVTEPLRVREDPAVSRGGFATPVMVQVPSRPRHVEITDRAGRVVTAIEVLSPTNKKGSGRRAYLRKQEAFLSSGTNLVEIDLLRAGDFVLSCGQDEIPDSRREAYGICVYRAETPELREYYPLPLRDPLPLIPIPLRPSDLDVGLYLQMLIDKTYRQGGYDFLDYSVPPEPPVTAEDAAWARTLVSADVC